MTVEDSVAVLSDLRRARRKQRITEIHWIDAFYQVYVTGIVVVVAVVLLSGVVGDQKLTAAQLVDVKDHGPAFLGVLAALGFGMGLRSGSRGGPLALEAPDVRHVLLAPVDRGVALRGPAFRQLRFLALCGLGAGAAAGQLAMRRMPDKPAAWIACGALFGLLVVALYFGAALTASGLRINPIVATSVAFVLIAWSVADAAQRGPTAPFTFAGRIAIWPLHFDPLALVPMAVALALIVVGFRQVSGTSLESAERRTSLVGQLKFAVTLQDLRTVLVLRRQLAMELPRNTPWIRAANRRPHFPVWHRGWRGVLRWPAARILRLLAFGAIAGLCLRGAYAGTTPLVVLAGLVLWFAALDAVEAMAQETDHPGLLGSFPVAQGDLLIRHLPASIAVMAVASGIAAAVALVPGGGSIPAGVAVVLVITMALLPLAGAAVSVVQGAPEVGGVADQISMMTPEVAGARTVFRTAWPTVLAVAGTLPVIAAQRAHIAEKVLTPEGQAAQAVGAPLVLVALLVGAWVKYREKIHTFFREAAEQASAQRELRAGGTREETDDDE